MLHLFQSFWSGPPLSPYENLCLQSFIDHGHDFVLYTYNTDLAVPKGVSVRDAREILDPSEFFVYKQGFGQGSPAGFSNLFRYTLLLNKGGWWVDTDVVCVKKDIPQVRMFYAKQHDGQFNNAVIYFEPGHPIMEFCISEARRKGKDIIWGQTGPGLMTIAVQQLMGGREIADMRLAYPIPVGATMAMFDPQKTDILLKIVQPAWFVHLWNQIIKTAKVDKTAMPPAGTFMEKLFIQHSIKPLVTSAENSAQ